MKEILRVKDLSVSYYTTERKLMALTGVTLSMKEGEVLGIVGESGCGKTTLAMSIARLLPDNASIESGKIIYKDMDILRLSQKQLEDIAKIKMPDLNTNDLEQASKTIAATAKNMGIDIKG